MSDVLMNTDSTYAGIVVSTFGRMVPEREQTLAENALDVRYFRLPVRWDGHQIVSSARGGNNREVETALSLYYSWPKVRFMLSIGGRSGDWHGYKRGDTAAVVRRLQSLGLGDMSRFDFAGPNEPDRQGATLQDVASRTVQMAHELSSTGIANKVWGPTWSHPGLDYLKFAQLVGPERLAGVDWHSYPGGAKKDARTVVAVLRDVANHYDAVVAARVRLALHGLPVEVNVDEMNWSWDEGHPAEMFTARNTVMFALAYCSILAAGGRVMAYATQNGALSVLADGRGSNGRKWSTPMPAYWGIAALTGAGLPGRPRLFPHYHDKFYVVKESGVSTTRTFAVSNEEGGVNVIVINMSKCHTSSHEVNLPAAKGTYDLFQSRREAPFEPPEHVEQTVDFIETVRLTCLPMTVSVVSCRVNEKVVTDG